MKKYLLLFGIVALLFSSCDLLDDATTVDINTELETSIPVSSTIDAQAVVTKSAGIVAENYTFTGAESLSLLENSDLKKYIDNIKSLDLSSGAVVTFPASVGGEISNCVLKYGVGTISNTITIPDSNADSNGNIVVTLDASSSQRLVDFVEANKKSTIGFELSGKANYEVKGSVKVVQSVIVEASAL